MLNFNRGWSTDGVRKQSIRAWLMIALVFVMWIVIIVGLFAMVKFQLAGSK